MMFLSDRGLEKTKEFEGLRLTAYQDSGGVWTIGYGHTGTAKPDMMITQEKADELLRLDVHWAVSCVNNAVTVKVNQNQFDALVDFTFNIGCGAFRNSTLLRRLNAKNYAEAAEEFTRWKFVKGVEVAGLLRRREADKELFMTPVTNAGV